MAAEIEQTNDRSDGARKALEALILHLDSLGLAVRIKKDRPVKLVDGCETSEFLYLIYDQEDRTFYYFLETEEHRLIKDAYNYMSGKKLRSELFIYYFQRFGWTP